MATNTGTSVLNGVKTSLGIGTNYTNFDGDLIGKINMTFGILHEMGAGPTTGFKITGSTEVWEDWSTDLTLVGLAQEYLAQKVADIFDPPTSTITQEAKKSYISELEYRIYVYVDSDGGFQEDEETEED